LIFEDVHWIDPTSLEALGRVVDKISTVRVLLIVTHRPEFQPPWTGKPSCRPGAVAYLAAERRCTISTTTTTTTAVVGQRVPILAKLLNVVNVDTRRLIALACALADQLCPLLFR
jgi:hypothetical protein